MSGFVQPPPRRELLWLAVDLDGTLAEPVWRPDNPTSEIGAPIPKNVEKLRAAVAAGYKPVIHTARPSTDYEAIEAWLRHHEIPFSRIQTGKILAALYIDDRARHADAESWLPGGYPAGFSKRPCPSQYGGVTCDRLAGHAGNHVCAAEGEEWTDDDAD